MKLTIAVGSYTAVLMAGVVLASPGERVCLCRLRAGVMVLLALFGMASALHTPTCTVAARCAPSYPATARARPLMQSGPPAESTLSSARLLKV